MERYGTFATEAEAQAAYLKDNMDDPDRDECSDDCWLFSKHLSGAVKDAISTTYERSYLLLNSKVGARE
jgi:hypothetical protein